jgi:hypothetical protein
MFVKYEVLGLAGDDYREEAFCCELTDTEFSVQFTALRLHSGLDVITPLVEIYESRGLPLAPNLAAFCAFTSKKYKVPTNQFITILTKANAKFAQNVKDIERYLILI